MRPHQCQMQEHQRAVRNTDTATSEHAQSTAHLVNWTEAHVIDTCSYIQLQTMLPRVLDDPQED